MIKRRARLPSVRAVRTSPILAASVFVFAAMHAVFLHAQDAVRGKQLYSACSVCHATSNDNGAGPGLLGIVGRKAGSAEGFRYSRAMKNAGIVWDDKTLDAYLSDPQKTIPGNQMPFSGIADPKDRADLIAYLKTLR
jgi:cytochrome c